MAERSTMGIALLHRWANRVSERGPGGLTDKAKEAADAIKEPGAGEGTRGPAGSPEAPTRPEPESKPGPEEHEGGRDA